MPPIALVPLRSPGVGKTRLAPALDPAQRALLAAAMLEDVVTAIRAAGLDEVVVAAAGPTAARAASELGARVLHDPPRAKDLDAVLAAATARLHGRDLLLVAADLPRLTATEVTRIVSTPAEVVVSPTSDGGTGALLRRPGQRIATAYGPGSAARHLRLAQQVGASCARVEVPGCRDDVDTNHDVQRLAHGTLGAATRRALERIHAAA